MKAPFISIVIPTRDRPELLKHVLKSIKQQDFDDFEVIISDNGINKLCYEEYLVYKNDDRFHYKRPSKPLDMCSHWEYAIEGANGKYLTIFCEKFIIRKDALKTLHKIADKESPDLITWQYEYFENAFFSGEHLFGEYHPLVKPSQPKYYDATLELERRFSLQTPFINRRDKDKNSYGKLYSGCAKNSIIKKIIDKHGKIFYPSTPDFTSMFLLLNHAKKCIDIAQSLMITINLEGASNGEKTKLSAEEIKKYLSTCHHNFDEYASSLPITNFWIGHNVTIARDMMLIKNIENEGPIKNLGINKNKLAIWAEFDLNQVTDWNNHNKDHFIKILSSFTQIDTDSEEMKKNALKPCSNEIYHAIGEKTNHFEPSISAKALAELHWLDKVAPPRKSIKGDYVSADDALEYFYQYNFHSCELLGVTLEKIS
ncbi:glycosyltransferase family 2 protein [Motilimonas cestriensis]|uniref:Glycosyltransferase family 2 protein n=1 Tax=Motilimonas cestriensis TaxID=2742685 RepID=A0ABS8WAR7_9GAMM|nr:glycosyltransferase family A protein [Motilimonas cestriensis]MCE2595570.1 glycosyltransferase family 2 protein [Motilimonas cestriensis]